jgi:solute:Na+ symporter, SSS family
MLSALDIAIVGAFLAYSVVAGLRARKVSSQSLDEYFLAGRTLPGWKAGISMAATQFAADTPLLVTGLIATAGVFSLWRLWIYALAFLLMGFVLGAPWRRAAVLTDAELAELRYGGRLALVLRAAKALYFGTIFNCAVLAMVLFAATRIAEPFLTWNEWLPEGVFARVVSVVEWAGVSLSSTTDPRLWAIRSANNMLSLGAIVAATTLYSATGGLRAVVDTDVVQFGLAIGATAAYAVLLVVEVGGLAELPGRLAQLYGAARASEILALTPTRAADAGWVVLGTIGIQWLAQMNADGTGYLAQRTMACRSDADAKGAALVFVVAQVVVRSLLWIPIGLALLVLMPATGSIDSPAAIAVREGTYIEGIATYLPTGLKGLMLTGMLAALASTVDTHLNWGASYWTNDLYKRVVCEAWLETAPSSRALVWVARSSTVLILALSVAVLTRLESIQSAWQATLLLGAGMGLPLVLRWLWWRVTALAELSAIVVSTICAPVLMRLTDSEGARLLVMAVVSAGVVVVVAVFDRVASSEARIRFYLRVRPPGFWGPTARACGDDPRAPTRRLLHGLAQTFGAAACVFCGLVATATLLFGSPPPTWFPWRGAWIVVLATLSIAGTVALAKWRPAAEPPVASAGVRPDSVRLLRP